MAQTVISEQQIEAHIHGDVSGQLAVGNNILQIGSNKGVVIFNAAPEQRPTIRPRQTPVDLRPRPFSDLLGRQSEVNNATTAMRSQQPVEFFGEDGLGKTALLRYLAHHSASNSFRDGVVYLDAGGTDAADLLYNLFGSFYKSDAPYKPSDAEVRHALHGKQALVILDDIDLTREEVDSLMDAAPRCTFLFASPARRLWNEGSTTALRGLPLPDALKLVERTLDRSLTGDEQPAAHAICTALKGHPLHIIQSVDLARHHDVDLQAIANQLQSEFPNTTLTKQILASLSEPEQRIVKALAALGNAPLHVTHVTAVTGLSNADDLLQKLQALKLVQSHSPRYSLTGTWAQTFQQQWDLSAWSERILIHLIAWAEHNRQRPDIVLPEFESILEILDWARNHRHWHHVLRLAWAVEGAFALSGRWDAWAHILQVALQAARALKNRAAEAWGLHQLGSRAGCLGDRSAASASLVQAIRIREQSGDHIGARISRHNLDVLLGTPVPPSQPPSPPSAPSTPAPASGAIPFVAKVIIALMTIPLIALIAYALSGGSQASIVLPPITNTFTPTAIDTASATATATATDTASAPPTAVPTDTSTSTSTPTSTATRTSTHTPTPTATGLGPSGCTLIAQYLADITIPDGTLLSPNSRFVKTWRIQNGGTCTWDRTYQLVFSSGTSMSSPEAVNIVETAPGQAVDISIQLVAPSDSGAYRGRWQLRSTNGVLFGGLTTDITVAATPTPSATFTPTTSPTVTLTPFTPTLPPPIVEFGADGNTLYWRLENVESAFLSGGRLSEVRVGGPADSYQVSPRTTTTYTLRVVLHDGSEQVYTTTVEVFNNSAPFTEIEIPNADTERGDPDYRIDGFDDAFGLWYKDVFLQGYANDEEDGTLSGDSLIWTTDRTDLQQAYLGYGSSVTARLYSNEDCNGTWHTITLTATDSGGQVAKSSRRIFIWTSC